MRSIIYKAVIFVSFIFLSNSLLAQEYSYSSTVELNAYRGISITTADLNKDNAPDIISGTFLPDQVKIFLNDGLGNFNADADFSYPVSSRPVGVSVADLNEDTHLDIITANYLDSTLSILFGKGDGSFNDTYTLKIPQLRAADVSAAYLNNDTHMDLAVVTQNFPRLLVLTGKGDGSFNPPIEYTTTGNPYDLKIADFDNDLDLDLAVSNGGGSSFYIHYNDGEGDFSNKVQQFTPAGPPSNIDVGFFNDDLFLDIVSVKGGNTVETLDVLINDQTGNVSQTTIVTPGNNMIGICLAKIDANAFLDAVSLNKNGLYVSFGDGAGGIINTDTVANYDSDKAVSLCVDDLNMDGRNDIIVRNDSSVFVYLENSSITSLENAHHTISGFRLNQNYPNPFNPSTVISYQIPKRSFVKIDIINSAGQTVKTIEEKEKEAGLYKIDFNAGTLTSGIYFYRINTAGYSDVGKMILLK